jgi:hypothetical protein
MVDAGDLKSPSYGVRVRVPPPVPKERYLPKISPEAQAVAAASLVQAHAAILGGVYAGRKEGSTVSVVPQELIEKMFSHYMAVIERSSPDHY